MRDTWKLIDLKLGAYVRGQAVLILLVATVLSLIFWAIGLPFWLLIGVFAGVVEIVPVDRAARCGRACGRRRPHRVVGVAVAAGVIVLVVRLIEDYLVIPRVLGDAVGLSPLLVLIAVTGVAILFGAFAVLLAIPIAAVVATLVDVIVLDKDPAEEEVPAVIFPGDGDSERRLGLAAYSLAPAAEDEAAEREPEPEGAEREGADRRRLANADRRCQRPSASSSSVVSGSPRRFLRARRPREGRGRDRRRSRQTRRSSKSSVQPAPALRPPPPRLRPARGHPRGARDGGESRGAGRAARPSWSSRAAT